MFALAKSRFSPQMLLAIAVGGYLIPGLLGYFFVLQPLFTRASDAQRERAATDEYLVLKNTASQLTQFKERLSSRGSTRSFLASLDSLATASGVSIVTVRPDTAVVPWNGGFIYRTYYLAIDGFYPQVNRFLDGIEEPNEYYIVTDFNLARIDNNAGRAQAQMRVMALTVPGP